mmetsp:Transcript_2045/g.1943  ORF Transcript_2045/g.1943 Transcript_2045/m.1943 type:complete len:85 (-) Transcript_2045:93-347(-)|eukprot:CAMPEP_0170557900 /NCGR_PEP_ID=MMETSP0211-20121228/31084_1 /TAXON_ID=311385 /ORGANISM="Pseudokeronopsis sp., Strain OXSARD2" /LENGTH=84 /DNA_ID=CAMNT_0010869333 /DNA_START=324 /DNA_END=578 /DNA_ORIENTATION=-
MSIGCYSYDNKDKPFENIGTLLKEFTTKISTEEWYRYRITTSEYETLFEILDDDGNFLEAQTIEHTLCGDNYALGYLQELYFGG